MNSETKKLAQMLIGVSTDYLTGSVDESVLKMQVEFANSELNKAEKLPISDVSKWIACGDDLPEDEKRVLCLHHDSENQFICWRTRDCNTGEPKWYGGAMPDYWQELPKAI